MNRFTPDLDLQQRLINRSFILLAIVLLISLLSLAGWIFAIDSLKNPISGLVAMNPVTALCFITLVVALRLKQNFRGEKKRKIAADIIVGIIFLIVVPARREFLGQYVCVLLPLHSANARLICELLYKNCSIHFLLSYAQ